MTAFSFVLLKSGRFTPVQLSCGSAHLRPEIQQSEVARPTPVASSGARWSLFSKTSSFAQHQFTVRHCAREEPTGRNFAEVSFSNLQVK
jgi:hypothetical protein